MPLPWSARWARLAALLGFVTAPGADVGERSEASARVSEAGNLSCFWTSASRFERFWSLADYDRFLGAARSSEPHGGAHDGDDDGDTLGLRHIFFVVKASQDRAAMAIRMERAWMHAAANRIYLVDGLIEGLPEHMQVVVHSGDREGGTSKHRDAVATSRLLIWLHQATVGDEEGPGGLLPGTRWVAILGDDVYVNLARLYYFLLQHPATDHPVAFAHVLSDTEVYDFDMPCLESGAMLLNMAAVMRIGETASCKECPHVGSDSISLGYCAYRNAVPLVHVPALHCHTVELGGADAPFTRNLLAHHWIAAGGLSVSELGAEADDVGEQVAHHPFEADFPNLACEPPSGAQWTVQLLTERMAFCAGGGMGTASEQSLVAPPALADGDVLSTDSIDAYFEARWPGQPPRETPQEVPFEAAPEDEADGGWRVARAALALAMVVEVAESDVASWLLLRPHDAWLHRAEAGRFLAALAVSELPITSAAGSERVRLAFAFLKPDSSPDLRAGLLLSVAAARALLAAPGLLGPPSAAALEAMGIVVVHTPWMVPDAAALPLGLRGMVSEGAVSGIWSVGSVRSAEMLDDLEAKAESRRFLAGMLFENFEDWARGPGASPSGRESCGVAGARAWGSFLHDDDEHIKVVRGFKAGRREFRTLHAMYRSEAGEALPLHGIDPDTVLVARNCSQVEA